MAPPTRETAPRKRRKQDALSRDKILDAAAELLTEEGLEAVTMAGVASRLGVAAMSLYAHVESKADLLHGVYERLFAPGPDFERAEGQPWDEWLIELRLAGRRMALTQPALAAEIASMYASNAVHGPVGIGAGGKILDVMVEAGMSEEDAARAYVTIHNFNLGFLLWEIPRFHTQTADDFRRDYLRRLAEADDPPTSATWTMLGVLTEQPIEQLYEDALRAVIAGVKARYLPAPASRDRGSH